MTKNKENNGKNKSRTQKNQSLGFGEKEKPEKKNEQCCTKIREENASKKI